MLQLLFLQLQLVFGLKLVAVQQEGNYKKAWELDMGSKLETETGQGAEDWEIAKGRNWDTAGKENDIFGRVDQQVEVSIELCHLEVWLWQLVLQW